MYRLDNVVDRVLFDSVESQNALNNFKELQDKFQEDIFHSMFTEDCKKVQQKFNFLVNKPEVIDELAVMFRLIDKNLDDERERNKRGIGVTLLAIILRNLQQSAELWKKIVLIVGDPTNRSVKEDFNKLLKRQSVVATLTEVIQGYLGSLCQLGEEFFVDPKTITDEKKRKLYSNIQLPHMIVVIHHLLYAPETSHHFAKNLFESFELSPAFISHLKLSLRTMTL